MSEEKKPQELAEEELDRIAGGRGRSAAQRGCQAAPERRQSGSRSHAESEGAAQAQDFDGSLQKGSKRGASYGA